METAPIPDTVTTSAIDIIDKLKSIGSLCEIDYPQLVVCGDQSSGKSSVLEGICGMRFPVDEGVCTRYPTEFIIRRGRAWRLVATIRPSQERSLEQQRTLRDFRKESPYYEQVGDGIYAAFTDVLRAAGEALGVGSDISDLHFAYDVLQISFTGPKVTPLTLVDLPGVFRGQAKNQTVKDGEQVRQLVLSYMKKRRTVNLVVISATADLATQEVTTWVNEYDPSGGRTLGIITKPDTINTPKQLEAYQDVLKKSTIPYKLGWHVLVNRSPEQQGTSKVERDEAEAEFLSRSPWASFAAEVKGIDSLLKRIAGILYRAIVDALPAVLRDCDGLIDNTRSRLQEIRNSPDRGVRIGSTLTRASINFHKHLESALKGNYEEMSLTGGSSTQPHPKQLFTIIEQLQEQLKHDLDQRGRTWYVVGMVAPSSGPSAARLVTHQDFVTQVAQTKARKNLVVAAGTINKRLISELFHSQSSNWPDIVTKSVDKLCEATERCCMAILDEVASEDLLRAKIAARFIKPGLSQLGGGLRNYASGVVRGQRDCATLTMGKSVTDCIPHGRNRETTRVLQALLADYAHRVTPTQSSPSRSTASARATGVHDLEDDMAERFGGFPGSPSPRRSSATSIMPDTQAIDQFAEEFKDHLDIERSDCSEAIECMEAIYHAQHNGLLIKLGREALSNNYLQHLGTLFTSEMMYALSPSDLQEFVGEDPDVKVRRMAEEARLEEMIRVVDEARIICRGREVRKSPPKLVPTKRSSSCVSDSEGEDVFR